MYEFPFVCDAGKSVCRANIQQVVTYNYMFKPTLFSKLAVAKLVFKAHPLRLSPPAASASAPTTSTAAASVVTARSPTASSARHDDVVNDFFNFRLLTSIYGGGSAAFGALRNKQTNAIRNVA